MKAQLEEIERLRRENAELKSTLALKDERIAALQNVQVAIVEDYVANPERPGLTYAQRHGDLLPTTGVGLGQAMGSRGEMAHIGAILEKIGFADAPEREEAA